MTSDKEFQRAKNFALRLLASRPYSVSMMKRKLSDKNYAEYSDYICSYYEELGYLSDEKFCEAYIKDAYSLKNHGKARIVSYLKRCGVDSEIIDKCFASINPDFSSKVCEIVASKAERLDLTVCSNRKKVCDYLIRRGFKASDVFSAVKKYST